MSRLVKKTFLIVCGLALAPALVQAQVTYQNDWSLAIENLYRLISALYYIAYSLVFLAFFWGFAKYLFSNSEQRKKEASNVMIISVVVMFVMLSIGGIVKLLQGTLSISSESGAWEFKAPQVLPLR